MTIIVIHVGDEPFKAFLLMKRQNNFKQKYLYLEVKLEYGFFFFFFLMYVRLEQLRYRSSEDQEVKNSKDPEKMKIRDL